MEKARRAFESHAARLEPKVRTYDPFENEAAVPGTSALRHGHRTHVSCKACQLPQPRCDRTQHFADTAGDCGTSCSAPGLKSRGKSEVRGSGALPESDVRPSNSSSWARD